MTAQVFLLNCFSLDSGNDDGGEHSHLLQHLMEDMLQRCGIQADWVDDLTWIYDSSSSVEDYLMKQELPVFCWQNQPELDFTLLAAAVNKIACGNGHVLLLAHYSGDAVHGCALVSSAAAGRFNLLPTAELSTYYLARRKDTDTVTVDEQVLQQLEKAGMAEEEIHSVLLAGTCANDEVADCDSRMADCQYTPVLRYLAEKTAGYSGSNSQIDVLANRAGKIIKNLMILKKL